MKICTKCLAEKYKSEYYSRDGNCKSCRQGKINNYRLNNLEKIASSRKKRYEENKCIILAKMREDYNARKDEIKLIRKAYRKKNPEKIKAWRKKDRDTNIERIRERDREYRQSPQGVANRLRYLGKNREKYREHRRVYDIERRKTDPQYKLLTNLRNRMNRAIKMGFKKGKTIGLIGCSIVELKKHLESQFLGGMSWSNYGNWHIDHRIPCAGFDLSTPEQQGQCFHYTNLQPLWGGDNMRKGAKIL